VELIPRGVIACIFVKNLADHFWELRRMMKLKHTAINCAMPRAAAKLLAPGYGDTITYVTRPRVEDQAKAVLYGDAAVELKAGEPTFEERMRAERVTSEMMVYRAHQEAAEWLEHISGECARIENRIHRLLRDFEARNATLASSARTLVEREAAQILGAERVN
jgi:hypothetical protein